MQKAKAALVVTCRVSRPTMLPTRRSRITGSGCSIRNQPCPCVPDRPASNPILPPMRKVRWLDVYEALAYVVWGTQRADTVMQDMGLEGLSTALDEAPDASGEADFMLGVTHLNRGARKGRRPPP